MMDAKKVDVLAVMDRDRNAVLGHSDYYESDLAKSYEARAIVAELIEAAREARVSLHSCMDALDCDEPSDNEALARLDNILSRLGAPA